MKIESSTFKNFKKITNYDLDIFFNDCNNFFKNDFPKIVKFYSGESDSIDKNNINNLIVLIEKSNVISKLFKDKKNSFKTIDFWYLLDYFEDIKNKLLTVSKISKYLRSSIISNFSGLGVVINHNLEKEQTLEDISKNILNDNDFGNEWINIAIQNSLREIDYDIKGGNEIKLRKKLFQSNLVTTVIDNTIGERIYGKDINKKLTFSDNDIETLSYKETAFQNCEVLSKLEKGDIPEYPELGLPISIYKNNMSQLNFPMIIREMRKNFATDDLFNDFKVRNIRLDNSDIFIEYEIDTKYELVIIKNINL